MGLILLLIMAIITAALVSAAVAAIKFYILDAILVFPALMGMIAGWAISKAAKAGRARSAATVTHFARSNAKQDVGMKFGSSYSSVSDNSPDTLTPTGPLVWIY